MATSPQSLPGHPRRGAFILLLLLAVSLLAALRVYLSIHLDLFGDEAFYRWESQQLAWSYSDLPPLTALAMRLGTVLGGDSSLALRSVFLLSATALPLAIYFLAHPVVGRNQALAAAALGLVLPPTALLGVMAIPDSLLLTECTLMLGCLERACRLGQLRWWLWTGLLGCLGFLTHYRFVFLPFPLVLAFLYFPQLRVLLRGPGPWLAAGLSVLGLVPLAMFNLGNDFGAIGFHFSERHPWAFHAQGLQYPLLQAGVVSPLLYGLLLWILWRTLRQARNGPPAYVLFGVVSCFYVFGLIALAPWVDQTSTTAHWAWFGYIPLLVFAPGVLLSLWNRGRGARLLAVATLALTGVFMLGSFISLSAALFYDALPPAAKEKVSVKMVGWDELRDELAQWLQPGEAIYTSDYYTAAQLREGVFTNSPVWVIDHDKLHRDGRALQLELWQASERHLPADGSSGLIVVDYKRANRFEVYRQIDMLCRNFQRIETLDEFEQFDGRRRYGIYRGHDAGPNPNYGASAGEGFCFPDILGRVDSQNDYHQPRSGMVGFHGYLLAQPEGIEAIRVRVGDQVFKGHYGTQRPDVQRALGRKVIDPNYPLVGFRGRVNTRKLDNGRHEMEFIGVSRYGRERVFRRHTLVVEN